MEIGEEAAGCEMFHHPRLRDTQKDWMLSRIPTRPGAARTMDSLVMEHDGKHKLPVRLKLEKRTERNFKHGELKDLHFSL